MKTVLILGGTGMLGSQVGPLFQSHPDKYQTFLTTRDTQHIYGNPNNWIRFDPTGKTCSRTDIREVFELMPCNPDFIINCIGAIKPQFAKSPAQSIYINALFPHELSEVCKALNIKLIHITTDCVWSGRNGKYVESDLHDALDDYGKSKSLGEPKDCMTIRTSIIGPEIKDHVSLIAWAQSQKGKEVSGFDNHLWSGMTTKQFGDVCSQIIDNDLYQPGLFHLYSDTVTKYELLQIISSKYDLGLKINKVPAKEAIDRSLSSEKDLVKKVFIPTIAEQISAL
jgi:dTDP-4-dehydrorhamnose reductase